MYKKNLLVTVSGGRSSARMARHIQNHTKYADYNKVFVFCNTGMERPETLINYCYFVFKNKYYAIEIINARYMFESDSFEGSSTINYLGYITKLLFILFDEEFLLQENSNHTRNVFFRLSHISQLIEKIAQDNNTTIEECLNIAYNEIKNRTVRIINGKFIKDEK